MGCGSSSGSQLETRGLIYIYYGTTTGNSSRLAFQFASEVRNLKFIPKIINLSEYNPKEMISSKLNVFFVSTYGMGSCTPDTENFDQWLFCEERSKNEFQGMIYLIFALGSTNHEHFCEFGIRLDKRLEYLGAKRLCNLGKGDAAKDQTENDYQQWIHTEVQQTLQTQFPLYTCDQGQQDFSTIKIQITKEPEDFQSVNLDFMALKYINSMAFSISEIKELKALPARGNSTLLLDLFNQNIEYKTAYNIAIYPQNSDSDVDELCSLLKLDKNVRFKVITNSKQPFPNPISVYTYLKKFCDFSGLVTKKILIELSNLVNQKQLEDELLHLASFEGRDQYQNRFINQKQNLLNLIKEYQINNLTLEKIIDICPLIQPRYFTIASSNKKHPKNIHILASQFVLNQERLGLSSQFFRSLKKGDVVKGLIQPSKFKYPKNPKAPILLIGIGAGLAPLRALIQERDYYLEKNQFEKCPFQGGMKLYYGCRTEAEYLCREELQAYLNSGTLSELKVAFSRKEPKQYVTELIAIDELYQHFQMDGLLYICGSTELGRDIQVKIADMFEYFENIDPYLTDQKIKELEENSQILTEYWG
ncbi:unnamed protein product (macronuclear) [Paramecium tetraurelia]|uniref:NADPH--hemoprotein reductase n=1 Tax=Paramecium tetraurelia TaxID=5888 RepID=Q6BGH8_PARTE|nr:NADPH-cytochrome P450 reductase [Paramecium tetraurelia strain d4-2]XP_001423472.1 uncharacterized protein GSPATT00000510001 [Paramecium tetraurelia]CAH03242.1 NADPH-cytochrome P450 reductase, putative [Paramecium tetraurelia]CAK56074.1 unnamed protein product [Paramecium tetraurelia]|eukprot:XP_001423472.1 hypothetical protein (macronuclear) [Paramecium tetraurelia strain d4-2]